MNTKALIRLKSAALAVAIAATPVLSPRPAAAQPAPHFLPLPEQAKPLPEPAVGYRLQHVGKRSYVVTSGFVQATFVVTQTGVVVIDAPPALAEKLPAAIKSVTDKPVTHVILSHDHLDHIGAATKAFKGAKLIAHRLTAELLKLYPDPLRPLPDITFDGPRTTKTIGGVQFQLIYPGPAHETGDIIVYVPEDKLVIMTDLVMPGWAPYRGWGNADHIPGLLKAYDAVLALDFDTYVGGHVYRTGTHQDVEDSRAFWVDTWRWTKEEMAKTPFESSVEPGNLWALHKVWFDKVADKVTARLVEKWGKRLGGVDVFTHDTVVTVIVSLSTDTPNIPNGALFD